MTKPTNGPEFDALVRKLQDAESGMSRSDTEAGKKLEQMMIDEGYDPEEVVVTLTERNRIGWGKLLEDAVVITLVPEPDQAEQEYESVGVGAGLGPL